MRQDMAKLRHSLQEQKIFSDKMMRHVMAERSSWINRFVKAEFLLMIPILILGLLFIMRYMGASWTCVIFTILFCSADAVWDAIINRLNTTDFTTLSLVKLKERLLKQRKMRRNQMMIEVPLVILWAGWFAYDLISNAKGMYQDFPALLLVIMIGVLLVIGIVIVFNIYRKMQATDSESLAEIERLQREI